MIDIVLGSLEILGTVVPFIPTMAYVLVILGWIFLIRKLHYSYRVSLKISLVLLLMSMILIIFQLKFIAAVAAELAFIFLTIATIQWLFQKS